MENIKTNKKNWMEIVECFNKYSEAKDIALDWLFISWEEKGTEKEHSFSMYEKHSKIARKYLKRLNKLTND